MKQRKIGIIGAGKVGVALGYLLKNKGYQLIGISSLSWERTQEGAAFIKTTPFADTLKLAQEVDCLFITTPDGQIREIAEYLATQGIIREGQILIHMSGALPAEVLAPAKARGALIFSLHPLQTFADVKVAIRNLPGSFFAAQGDQEVLPLVAQLVEDLGGEMAPITKESKALYHAGACVACNYLVSLLDIALTMYESIGISRDKSLKSLLPLVKGTVTNLENLGVPQALTGPIARGDGETIQGHLLSLGQLAPELIDLYTALGIYTVSVGEAKGTLSSIKGEEIKNIFQGGRKENA